VLKSQDFVLIASKSLFFLTVRCMSINLCCSLEVFFVFEQEKFFLHEAFRGIALFLSIGSRLSS